MPENALQPVSGGVTVSLTALNTTTIATLPTAANDKTAMAPATTCTSDAILSDDSRKKPESIAGQKQPFLESLLTWKQPQAYSKQ